MYYNLNAYIEVAKHSATIVPMDSIMLTEKIHKRGVFQRPAEINKEEKDVPLIIRGIDDGKYSLVCNWRVYKLHEADGDEFAKAIIIDANRKQFFNFLSTQTKYLPLMDINEIEIKEEFKQHPPQRYKIDNAADYYKRYGRIDKPVVIDENRVLVDGYARYCAAKELGVERVSFKYYKKEWK